MKKTIGILGGMGPGASNYLYNTLINMSIQKFGAKNNDEFPDIILFSVPVPDFISDESRNVEALRILQDKVVAAKAQRLSCFSFACNTAHLLLDQLQSKTKVPFISMIDEVVKRVTEDNIRVVGIMGTPSTIKHAIYQKAFAKQGIKTIVPNKSQIKLLEGVIRNIIKGDLRKDDEKTLKDIADSLKKHGAKGVVLGCTELPLVFPKGFSLPVYNSVAILAEALLRKYYKPNTMGEKL